MVWRWQNAQLEVDFAQIIFYTFVQLHDSPGPFAVLASYCILVTPQLPESYGGGCDKEDLLLSF